MMLCAFGAVLVIVGALFAVVYFCLGAARRALVDLEDSRHE